MIRIGHASISENNNNGRDGRAQTGDQTGKEVCIRSFYKKPWKYLLRCIDSDKAEKMARACESICNNNNVGYDQSQRLTLHKELALLNYDYERLRVPCECDCSSFMTVCAECAGIFPQYTNGNAPVTANMVKLFEKTGMFEVLTEGINEEYNLRRGDILVGAPNTHTVMVLDNGTTQNKLQRPILKRFSSGEDVKYLQRRLIELGYPVGWSGIDGYFGQNTEKAVKNLQKERNLKVDGIVGPATWAVIGE